MKIGFYALSVAAALFLVPSPSHGTVWFFADNEEGAVGANSPNSTQGPYYWEYMSPGPAIRDESVKYANATPRRNGGKYMEVSTWSQMYPEPCARQPDGTQLTTSLCGYYWQSWNPNGTFGAAFSEANPINLTNGTTYYLAGFFRFQRIGGRDIWRDTNSPDSYTKLFDFVGNNRWMILAGWPGVYSGNFDHKFTFDLYSSPSGCTGCGYNEKNANVAPYSSTNPYLCDYDKWYAVVMGFTPQTGNTGRVELWINGTKTTSLTQKVQDAPFTQIQRLQGGGTAAQPAYDAPPHKFQFDGLTFSDDLALLQSRGYFSNPDPGTAPPMPTPTPAILPKPTNLRFAP